MHAQSDNLTMHMKDYDLVDRLDIRLRNDSTLGFSTFKPFNRQTFTQRIGIHSDMPGQSGARCLSS